MPIPNKVRAIFDNTHYIGTIYLSHEAKSLGEAFCVISQQCFSKNEYQKRGARLREITLKMSRENRAAGLNHPIHGHLNKHLLKIKYANNN